MKRAFLPNDMNSNIYSALKNVAFLHILHSQVTVKQQHLCELFGPPSSTSTHVSPVNLTCHCPVCVFLKSSVSLCTRPSF